VTTRGYTGQEMLDSLCLINLNARIYDPALGRLLSADPTVPSPLNGQAFNRYSYVLNNPLALTDPSGYWSCSDGAVCHPILPTDQGGLCGGPCGTGAGMFEPVYGADWMGFMAMGVAGYLGGGTLGGGGYAYTSGGSSSGLINWGQAFVQQVVSTSIPVPTDPDAQSGITTVYATVSVSWIDSNLSGFGAGSMNWLDGWSVQAAFGNPRDVGGYCAPLFCVHTEIQIRHNGNLAYAFDGAPNGYPGNLIMQNDISSSVQSIIPPFHLPTPNGISTASFVNNIIAGAEWYDNALPYSLPPLSMNLTAADTMAPGTYNSNSLAAGILVGAGAIYDVSDMQFYLSSQGYAAPGLEQPIPESHFH
jgi:RHS repeat-associated protein